MQFFNPPNGLVALLTEGVDRNYLRLEREGGRVVALLAEGVDRNTSLVWKMRYS